MPDIACPECGLISTLPAIRRASDEFCHHCDYPLFWAPTAVPVSTGSVNSDTTLRRLPGAGGRQMIGTRVCPHCGELNGIAAIHCTRCGGEMDPKPVVVLVEPEPEPEPPPPPPPPPGRDLVPLAIMAIIAVLVLLGWLLL